MESPDGTSAELLAVAHIGDFSVSNWGDKLYPAVLASLLTKTGFEARVEHFAPLAGTTIAGDAIRPLRDVAKSGADVAFVGGGDLLRFNSRTIAMDHLSIPTQTRSSRVSRVRARLFARRHFLPGPGPWIPDTGWLDGHTSVLLSVGGHTIPAEGRRAVGLYRAAWVRTANGAEHLRVAGMDPDRIIVGPDMVFALAELENQEATRARGEAILREHGFEEPPLIFQAAEFHGWPLERVSATLAALKGIPTATLALGSYAGEDQLLRAAGERNGVPSLPDLGADEITAVLAGAGAVFTTSMHAAIVGASFGTSVIVPGVAKTHDAFAVLPNPPRLHAATDETLREIAADVMGKRLAHSTDANRDAVVAAFAATLRAADLR